MYKVLLVDDELDIIEGLTAIIDWYSRNCTIVGTAYNGRMGAQQAALLKPDIIVTDIRMPLVEGIEMIATIKKTQPHIKFIILSGFSEFEYAKRGMELGVKHYVLKPVEEIELEASIDDVVLELDQEQQNEKLLLQEYAMLDLLHASEDNEEILATLESNGIKFDKPYITCMTAKADDHKYMPGINVTPLHRSNDFTAICLRYSAKEHAIVMVHAWKDGPLLHEAVATVRTLLLETLQSPVTLGVGATYDSPQKISQSFDESRRVLGCQLLDQHEGILLFDQLNDANSMAELPPNLLQQLDYALEQNQQELCSQIIEQILDSLTVSAQHKQIELRPQCLNLYLITAGKLTTTQVQQLNRLVGDELLSMKYKRATWTIDMCKSWLTTLFQSIIQLKKQHQPVNGQTVIEEVQSYLKDNYSQSITLSSVAEQFYISPNHLSHLFRKKTGDTFLGYLTKIRMERAKFLIANSQAKMYEICQLIGYEDPKYFRKTFEKVVGMNPSDYKNANVRRPG